MELNKPNDMFVTSILTPDVKVLDLLSSEITSDNTSFFNKEQYKDTKFVKEAFKNEEGNFDELKFNDAYTKAAELFEELSSDNFLKNNLEWDAFDLTKPTDAKVKQNDLKIEQDLNPYKSLYGRTSLNSVDAGDLTIRELAQQSKIFDTKSGKFEEKSANDLGLFGSWFNDTLVYAQYEDDDYHEDLITGRKVSHKKGEYKLNDEGSFYVETLGGRNIAGKQVVNPTDLITTDGSAFNKIDFFDSDGEDKSIVGTTFKLVTQIAPFLIPYKNFNTYYGGFKMVTGLASVLPTFYKSIEGILLGDSTENNETALWKAATKTQGFMAKYNTSSYSDAGTNSMWNYEQMGDMVSSIFSQVYEQRAAAKLSTLFYKVNSPEYAEKLTSIAQKELLKGHLSGSITEKTAQTIGRAAMSKVPELAKTMEKQSQLAKALSLGYMSLTQSAEIYQDALDGGYDRRTAGLASLLAAGGQYSLMMNNRMGDWFLDKSVGYSAQSSRAAVKSGIKEFFPDLESAVKKITIDRTAGKVGLSKVIGNIKNSIKKAVVDPILSSGTTEKLWTNAFIEGVEEVTEQAVMDATKGIVDTMSWLGMTKKQGSFNTIENVFSQAGLQNYLANMFGGFIGGGIFEINRLKIEPFINGKALDTETNFSLLRQISNGDADKIKNEIRKQTKSIGNTELSPITSKEGERDIFSPNNKESQAFVIAESAIKYVDYLDNLLNSENLKGTDEELIKKTILDEIRLDDLESSGIHKFILSDINELTAKIVENNASLDGLDPEKDKVKYSEVSENLAKNRAKINEILTGQKSDYYKGLSTFSLNRDLHSSFISLNVADYAKQTHGVNFYELPEEVGTLTKKSVQAEFNKTMDESSDKKNKMKFMFESFKTILEKYSGNIGNYAEEKHIKSKDLYLNILTNAQLLSQEQVGVVQSELTKSGLNKYNLKEFFNINLGDVLVDNNYLNLEGLSSEEIEVLKEKLNKTGLPYEDLNADFLTKLFQSERALKINELNKKIADEAEQTNSSIEEVSALYINEYEAINKETPVFLNPQDMSVLPLDMIYLADAVKDQPILPKEVLDVFNKRIKNEVETVKENFKKVAFINLQTIKNAEEDDHIGEFNIDLNEIEKNKVDLDNIILSITNSTDAQEIHNLINDLFKYIESIDNQYVKSIFKNQFSQIKNINPIFIKGFDSVKGKEIEENKLLDLLKIMEIEIFNSKGFSKTSVFDLLKDELAAFELSESSQEYVRSTDIIDSMKKALEIIEAGKSINSAMLNSSIDASNPYGFNVSLRNTLIKEKREAELDKYKVIDSSSYYLLNTELDKIKEKINFLIDLSESNAATIAVVQEQIKENIQGLFLKTLTDKENSISIMNLKVNGENLVNTENINKILAEKISDEEKLYKTEELIYNSFKKYSGNKDEALKSLFEVFNNNDFKETVLSYVDSGFTRGTKSINTFDYFKYLHTIIASSTNKFYWDYKNMLKKEVSLSNDRKAPFYSQEISIRQIYSYRADKRTMAHSMKFIKNLLETDRVVLENSLFIPGSGGTGKTNVVSNFAWRMDVSKDVELITTAPSTTVLEKLSRDISREKEDNTTSYSKEEILKKILGDKYDTFKAAISKLKSKAEARESIGNETIDDIINIKKGIYELSFTDDFINSLVNPFSKEHDTVLYLDEVSWMNPLESLLLDKIASMEGSRFYFVGLGDPLQNGFSWNDDVPGSLDTFYYNHPPKMKSVIRAENIHQQANVESLEIALLTRFSNAVDSNKYPNIQAITLAYSEAGDLLNGSKNIKELNTVDLKKLDTSKEIVVITDDGTISEKDRKTIEDSGIVDFNVLSKHNIQGREFDQVISLANIKYNPDSRNSIYGANKQLYTLLSRGKISTLMVGNSELMELSGINQEKKDTTSEVRLKTEQIDELLKRRLELLESIVAEYVEEVVEENPDIEEEEEASIHKNNTPKTEEIFENDDKGRDRITQEEYDGNNTFLAYSFYNKLEAKIDVDGALDIKPIENFMKSDMQFSDELSQSTLESNTPQQLIHQFTIAKNHLMHGLPIPNGNLYKEVLDRFSDGDLVIRKIKHDSYSKPYGKTHMLDTEGNERSPKDESEGLFLTLRKVFQIDGVTHNGYITIAAMPDINSEKWIQVDNKQFLTSIYESLQPNQDVKINGELNPLTGIRTIYSDGTTVKKDNNMVSISGENIHEFKENLLNLIPGLLISDLDKLMAFDHDEQHIKDELRDTGYKLTNEKSEVKNVKSFRFKPYMKVSYINPKDDSLSKLMVFQAKKRSILQAKDEYERIKEEFKNIEDNKVAAEKYIKGEFPALIAKWNGVLLLMDILDYYKDERFLHPQTNNMISKSDYILEELFLLELSKEEKENQFDVASAFVKMQEIIKKSDYSVNNLSENDKNFLLGKIKGETRLSNLGLRLFDTLSREDFEDFSDNKDNYQVYYNPIWTSTHSNDHMVAVDPAFIKYLEINVLLEPPIFTLKIDSLEEDSTEVVEERVEETPIEILQSNTFQTPFVDGAGNPISVDINLQNYEDPELALKTISSVNSSLLTILSKLSLLDSKVKDQIVELLKPSITRVINGGLLLDVDGNIDSSSANKYYKDIIKKSDIFETIDEYLEDEGLLPINYFLTGTTLKIDLDFKNFNTKLCK